MADDQKGVIHAATDGGVSGEHAAAEPFQFLVGPTTTDQFNTARLRLIPIACWRVDDVRFAFDSSFVNADTDPDNPNDIRSELRHLLDLVHDHPGAPLSVFGYADPVGSNDYNKLLIGRRAMAIYALRSPTASRTGRSSYGTMCLATNIGLRNSAKHADIYLRRICEMANRRH